MNDDDQQCARLARSVCSTMACYDEIEQAHTVRTRENTSTLMSVVIHCLLPMKTSLKADREDLGGWGKRHRWTATPTKPTNPLLLIFTRTHSETSRGHPGSHITSSQQSQTPKPNGTAAAHTRMTIRSPEPPATGSRTQDPLRFPGLDTHPNLRRTSWCRVALTWHVMMEAVEEKPLCHAIVRYMFQWTENACHNPTLRTPRIFTNKYVVRHFEGKDYTLPQGRTHWWQSCLIWWHSCLS